MKTLQLSILSVLISLFCVSMMAQTNYYVKPASSGLGNGSSWADATTLSSALASSVSGDIVHMAAGTYIPSVLITTGSDDLDMTFEIKKNITLTGGYPANPVSGDEPSAANKTTLNGEFTPGYNAYHVVAITAPVESGKKVSLNNICITGGKAAISTATALTINTLSYVRLNGSAMIIGGSEVELNNCRIYDNQSGDHTPGVYVFSNANLTFNKCTVENNTGIGNGAGLWAASSTVFVNNSSIIGNKCGGVGAIQLITNSKGYFYNSTIANNVAGYNNTTNSRNGSGIYVRDGSVIQVVNCTIYGNESNGNGAGIALHTSNVTTYPLTKATVINSTITGNKSTILDASTAGVYALTAGCTVDIQNSIISGNSGLGTANYDLDVKTGSVITKLSSVVVDKVYDASGVEIEGQTFDFTTMMGSLADNGGFSKTCQLQGVNNPAKTLGMSSSALTTLGASLTPVIPESIMAYDQLGNRRKENVIGAWTANKPISGFSSQTVQKPIVYVNNNNVYVKSEMNDRISVFAVTGQYIQQVKAIGTLTQISDLTKGNIFIVNVNGQCTKVIF